LQDHNADVEIRDFFKEPFTVAELTKLIGTRPITDFISTRAKSYKEQGWGKKPPTKKQAIAAMVKEPTLLRRPLLIDGKEILIGFSQSAYEAKVK
jgi:arsenate reductase-like glutaredoxin family protein